MSESFKLEIITPENKIFDDGVLSATFSGTEGEFTVLAKHENGIFLLKVGKIQLVQADGKTKSIISSASTVQVLDNSVKVLIDKSTGCLGKKQLMSNPIIFICIIDPT